MKYRVKNFVSYKFAYNFCHEGLTSGWTCNGRLIFC